MILSLSSQSLPFFGVGFFIFRCFLLSFVKGGWARFGNSVSAKFSIQEEATMNTLRNLMAGILMLLALIAAPVSVLAAFDTTQPTTSATLTGTKGGDGWFTTSVTVTLAAADGADGSGVAKTEYSLDNVTWQIYSSPFVIDKDGDQYVYFRSTDLAGNVEAPAKSQEIKINKTGLIGWWKMEGEWKDSSVVGNDGMPNNGVSFSSNAKVGATAGSFDGANDFVEVINKDGLMLNGPFTLESWVRFNAFSSAWTPLSLIQAYRYGVFYNNSSKLIDIHRTGDDGVLHYNRYNLSLNTGAWYHVVQVYDGKNLKLYINGQEKQPQGVYAQNISNTNNSPLLGNGWTKAEANRLNGLLDDVRIYSRAISDAEIQEHYRNYVVNAPTVNPVPSSTASPSITLSGTKQDGSAIVVNGNTLVPLDGTTNWQANYALSAGTNNLTITAVDSQNFISLPVALTVVLDATPPQVTATTPLNNAIMKTAPVSVTFTLADAISPVDYAATLKGAAVTAAGSNVPGTWSSSGSGTSGTVTFTPSAAMTGGSYTATIKPTDTLANGSTYSLTFTVDSTPPVAPGIDAVTTPINTTSKTITGTRSSDSASIAFNCAGTTIGTVSYPTATTWSVNVSGLKEGSNAITAYAIDLAGNQSVTASATITVDTTPPAVSTTPGGGIYNSAQTVAMAANEQATIYYTLDSSIPTVSATMYSQPISIPTSATLKYFGRDLAGNNSEIKIENYVIDTTPPVLAVSTLSDGSFTNNEILNIAGTVTDNTGVKGITINDTAVQVNPDGSFSYALILKSGVNIISTAATDSVGNMAADTRKVILDQTAPVLAITSPADNSKTGKMLLEVSGTVDETSVVTVRVKDTVQNALMNSGVFTATITLEPGYNTIEITATDLAGNLSSLKRTVLYDDQKPSLAIIKPGQDIRTNQKSLTIKGTVYDALTAVGVTISKDSEVFSPPVIDGTFEQVMNFSEEKTYAIVVTATNEAGTSSDIQRNIIYDITPPSLSIDPVTSPTSQPSLSVTGAREAGTAVTVTCTTATVGGVSYPTPTTWQADITGLTEGNNVITAASADVAGNTVTKTTLVVLASRPPQITITATPDVIWPPDHKMVPVTIAGGVNANGSIIKSVSISVSDEYGKYEYKNLAFGSTVMLEAWRNGNDTDGRKYTIAVVVTDLWGGTTTKTATVTVPHDAPSPKAATVGTVTANGTNWSTLISGLPKGTDTITVSASDAVGNITSSSATITIGTPDGILSGAGKIDIADAIKGLRIAAGFVTPTARDLFHGDVAPLDANGTPAPDGKIDIADALVILRKVVGLVSF
jgi:hypothetical protein